MRPSEQAWAANEQTLHAMRVMPFNAELAAGTLARERFRHYMIQDAVYLVGYARVLSLAAARAPSSAEILEFAQAAQTAIIVERALHANYLDQFGVSAAAIEAARASPACEAYVNFMLAEAATGSFATLVGAILPCFWVYRDVGVHVAKTSPPGNFYQSWIDAYTDESFAAATQRMIAIFDQAHAGAAGGEQARMQDRFAQCCRYEWMFWDAAYRCETWPV